MMKVVKLNRNYNGYGFFSHRVEFIGGRSSQDRIMIIRQWINARNWLWTQFGPSGEQALARADNFNGVQPKWAWDSEKSALYLKDEAYTAFVLKKEFWERAENL